MYTVWKCDDQIWYGHYIRQMAVKTNEYILLKSLGTRLYIHTYIHAQHIPVSCVQQNDSCSQLIYIKSAIASYVVTLLYSILCNMDRWLLAVTSDPAAKGPAKDLEVAGAGPVHCHFSFPLSFLSLPCVVPNVVIHCMQ